MKEKEGAAVTELAAATDGRRGKDRGGGSCERKKNQGKGVIPHWASHRGGGDMVYLVFFLKKI